MAIEINNASYNEMLDAAKNQKLKAVSVATTQKQQSKAINNSVLKNGGDTLSLSKNQPAKKKKMDGATLLLAVCGSIGLAGLMLINKKHIAKFLGLSKNALKGESGHGTKLDSELEELISKVERGESIIDNAPEKPINAHASGFSEVPDGSFIEVPDYKTSFSKPFAKRQVDEITKGEIDKIERSSISSFDNLYEYYQKGGQNLSKEKQEQFCFDVGQKLVEDYSEKLIDTGKFVNVAERLANQNFKNGNLSDSKLLLEHVLKLSQNVAHKADLYEQLAVIAQKTGNRSEMGANYNKCFSNKLKLVTAQVAKVEKSKDSAERVFEESNLNILNDALTNLYRRTTSKGVSVPLLKEAIGEISSINKKGIHSVASSLDFISQSLV